MNTIYCKNRDEWRAWLEQNHAIEKDIWLIYYKKHTKKETIFYSEAVDEALCFGWIDSTAKTIDDETYMQRYSPRKAKSVWSLVNKNKVKRLIEEKKMTQAGILTVKMAKENGQWENAYSLKDKVEILIELEHALNSNQLAFENFYKFSQSNQQNYIRWVVNAKRAETIRKRIDAVVCQSEKNLKPGM